MSAQEKDQESSDGGSVWTSYSDLFMTVAVVFLIMFVFSMLSAGITKVEAIKAERQSEDSLRAKIPEKEVEQSAVNLAIAEKTIEEINEKKEAISAQMAELTKLADSLNDSRSAISSLYQDQIKKAGMLAAAKEEIERQEQAIAKGAERQSQLEKLQRDAERRIDELQAERDQQVEQLKIELARLQEQVNGVENEKAALTKKIADRETERKQVNQQVEQLQSQLAQTQSESLRLAKQLEGAESKAAEIREELTQSEVSRGATDKVVEQLRTELKGKESEINGLKGSVAKLESEGAELRSGLAQKNGELDGLRTELGDLQGALAGKGRELAGAQSKIGELGGALAAQGDKVEGLQASLGSARGELERLKGELGGKDAELKSLRSTLDKARGRLSSLANDRRDIAQAIAQKLRNGGVAVETDPNTGVLTLSMDDAFYFHNNSAEMTESAKAKIRKIMPLYAEAILSDPATKSKIAGVTITGFASPRFGRKFIDPATSFGYAYSYNLMLSMDRARAIAEFIFSDDATDFAHKAELKSMTSVSGKGFMEPMPAGDDTDPQDTCGPYDCKKSRRVEIAFVLRREAGVDRDIRSITELMAH